MQTPAAHRPDTTDNAASPAGTTPAEAAAQRQAQAAFQAAVDVVELDDAEALAAFGPLFQAPPPAARS